MHNRPLRVCAERTTRYHQVSHTASGMGHECIRTLNAERPDIGPAICHLRDGHSAQDGIALTHLKTTQAFVKAPRVGILGQGPQEERGFAAPPKMFGDCHDQPSPKSSPLHRRREIEAKEFRAIVPIARLLGATPCTPDDLASGIRDKRTTLVLWQGQQIGPEGVARGQRGRLHDN